MFVLLITIVMTSFSSSLASAVEQNAISNTDIINANLFMLLRVKFFRKINIQKFEFKIKSLNLYFLTFYNCIIIKKLQCNHKSN